MVGGFARTETFVHAISRLAFCCNTSGRYCVGIEWYGTVMEPVS